MAYVWQRWLADEFRAAGLTVIEVDGWRNRGRPASTGDYDPRHGLTKHHTGATSSKANPGPTLRTLIVGRPDLPGPLAPWSVRFDGVVVVIAAGRCNHAGRVGKRVPFAALGADGNALFMGDEVDTNGIQKLPAAQRHAVAVTAAVYLDHFRHRDEIPLHRHEDISGTGKWDIGNIGTAQLRQDAARVREDEDMDYRDWPDGAKRALQDDVSAAVVSRLLGSDVDPGKPRLSVRQALRQAANGPGLIRKLGKALGHNIDK